jgi:superfamily II DNA or RNA helicase
MNYKEFLHQKTIIDCDSGFDIPIEQIDNVLKDFQRAITKWALKRGRAAIFADTGLGKTPMQLIWSRIINQRIRKPILIFSPLAVSKQTKREGHEKFFTSVNICESQNDVIDGVNITNYEKLHKFSPDIFGGIVIDESSILKGFDGKFRKAITEFAELIPYRLACTATPAPNDLMEIINHAEFLGIMKQKEITGLFFIQDGNVTHKWRLKHHAEDDFYKWLASWAVALKKPSDIGFSNEGFDLPTLNYNHITVKSEFRKGNQLSIFPAQATSLRESQIARKESINARISKCTDVVKNGNGSQWLIWCDLNKESNNVSKSLLDAVEVKGADKQNHKENSMIEFQKGNIRILVSKPSICGFGMNWQNCHNMIFLGLSHSFEKMYQAIRRCWRFGQEKEVNVYIITSDAEQCVVENIQRKEKEVGKMMDKLIKNMNLHGQISAKRDEMPYKPDNILKLPLFLRD